VLGHNGAIAAKHLRRQTIGALNVGRIMPHIAFGNVTKEYLAGKRHTVAIANFSLEIERGSFVSLVGPSGCGKSTILLMLAGLLEPSSGTIAIDGKPVAGPNERIGTVFQDPHLLPWHTVLRNVLFPVDLRRKNLREFEPQARELLKLTRIEGFAEHYPHELSGGMRQRASICRALILNPDILLMDEPFSALDAMTREEMTYELQRIWSSYGKTVIFVTHSVREAVFLSDRIVVIGLNPNCIIHDVSVPLERPRTAKMETQTAFNLIVDEIRDSIVQGHKYAKTHNGAAIQIAAEI
jgi:NitT/TauT family transport system ATP-binding protein